MPRLRCTRSDLGHSGFLPMAIFMGYASEIVSNGCGTDPNHESRVLVGVRRETCNCAHCEYLGSKLGPRWPILNSLVHGHGLDHSFRGLWLTSYPSLRSPVIAPCVLDAVEGCVASPSESGNSGASHTCTITKVIGRVVVVHACGRSGLWRSL